MKITFLVSHIPPKWIGGTEIQTLKFAKALSKTDDVTILTRKDLDIISNMQLENYKIIRFKYIDFPIIRFFSHILFSFLELYKNKKDINILICQMLLPNGIVGILANRLLGIKSVVWVRGSDWYGTRDGYKKVITHFVIKNSKYIIVQTSETKKDILINYPDANISIIPNGIDVCKIPNISKRDIDILYVGRITKVKGIQDLVKAIKLLNKNINTIILGDGSDKAFLTKECEGYNVSFKGNVSQEEVLRYMRRSKVLVMPSYSEGFPNVILEAMSCSLPVIATNVCGVSDIIKHNYTGILIEKGNPLELSTTITKFLKNNKKRRFLSKNCHKEIKKYYFKNIVIEMKKVLQLIPE